MKPTQQIVSTFICSWKNNIEPKKQDQKTIIFLSYSVFYSIFGKLKNVHSPEIASESFWRRSLNSTKKFINISSCLLKVNWNKCKFISYTSLSDINGKCPHSYFTSRRQPSFDVVHVWPTFLFVIIFGNFPILCRNSCIYQNLCMSS